MFCPNCGNKVSDTVSFCPKCGKKLSHKAQKSNNSDDQTPKSGRFLYCPKCGTELPTYADFCPKCGTKVKSGNMERIKDIGNEGAEKAVETVDKGVHKVNKAVNKSAEKINELGKKGSQKFSSARALAGKKVKKIKWRKGYTIAAAVVTAVIVAAVLLMAFINRPQPDGESNYDTAITNAFEAWNIIWSKELSIKDVNEICNLMLSPNVLADISNMEDSLETAMNESSILREKITDLSNKEIEEAQNRFSDTDQMVDLKAINSAERLSEDQVKNYQIKIREASIKLFSDDFLKPYYEEILDLLTASDISEETVKDFSDRYNDLRFDVSNLQVSDGYNVKCTIRADDELETLSLPVLRVNGFWVVDFFEVEAFDLDYES